MVLILLCKQSASTYKRIQKQKNSSGSVQSIQVFGFVSLLKRKGYVAKTNCFYYFKERFITYFKY